MAIATDGAGNVYNFSWKREYYPETPTEAYYNCTFTKAQFTTDFNSMLQYLKDQGNPSSTGTFNFLYSASPNPSPSIFNTNGYEGWFLRFAGDSFGGAIASNLGWENHRYLEATQTPTVSRIDWLNDYDWSQAWHNLLLWFRFEKRFFTNEQLIFDESINADVYHIGYNNNTYYPIPAEKLITLGNLGGSTEGVSAGYVFGTTLSPNLSPAYPARNYRNRRNVLLPTGALTIQFNIRLNLANLPAVNYSNEIIAFKPSGQIDATAPSRCRIELVRTVLSPATYVIRLYGSTLTQAVMPAGFDTGAWVSVVCQINAVGITRIFLANTQNAVSGINLGADAVPLPFTISRLLVSGTFYVDDLSVHHGERYISTPNLDQVGATIAYSSPVEPPYFTQTAARIWLPELLEKHFKHCAVKILAPGAPSLSKGFLATLLYANQIYPVLRNDYPGIYFGQPYINALATASTVSIARLFFYKLPFINTGNNPMLWFHYFCALQNLNDIPNLQEEDKYAQIYCYIPTRFGETDYGNLNFIAVNRVNLLTSYNQPSATTSLTLSGIKDVFADQVIFYLSENPVNLADNNYAYTSPVLLGADGSGYRGRRALNFTSVSTKFTVLNSPFENQALREIDAAPELTIDFWFKTVTTFTGLDFRVTLKSGYTVWVTSATLQGTPGTTNFGSHGFSVGTWNHVAFVRSRAFNPAGTTWRAFANGVLLPTSWTPTVTQSVNPDTGTGNPLLIIGHQSGTANIFIDEFRITRAARWTASFTPPTYDDVIHYPLACSDAQTPKGFNATPPSSEVWATDCYLRDKITVSGVAPYVGRCPNLLYGHDGTTDSYQTLRVYKIDSAATGGASPYFICVGKFGVQNKEALLLRTKIPNDAFL